MTFQYVTLPYITSNYNHEDIISNQSWALYNCVTAQFWTELNSIVGLHVLHAIKIYVGSSEATMTHQFTSAPAYLDCKLKSHQTLYAGLVKNQQCMFSRVSMDFDSYSCNHSAFNCSVKSVSHKKPVWSKRHNRSSILCYIRRSRHWLWPCNPLP